MTLGKRIVLGVSVALTLAIVSFAVVLSHNGECVEPDPPMQDVVHMTAIMQRCYGSADVLTVEQVEKPALKDDRILVKVVASSVNPVDWHFMTGTPYVMRLSAGMGRPEDIRVGTDYAGIVEAIGKNVTAFKPGDAVFGAAAGAFAEYVSVSEKGGLARKPENLTFEQAAAMPVAAVTALQALRDHGHVQAGSKILINGASGGVGTFAVQIAKSMGAEVTGVCSTRNVSLVRSIGADRVIDYTQEDFTKSGERYDVVIDNVGNHGPLEIKRVLKPGGRLVLVGAPKRGAWIGPLWGAIKTMMVSPFVEEEMAMFMAQTTQADMNVLADLAREGKMTPVIDRRYSLPEVHEAMRYLGTQRARGKVVIAVSSPDQMPQLSGL